ncbi:MAG: hypothetical protein AAF333_02715 [Planctomycetota bacterium]
MRLNRLLGTAAAGLCCCLRSLAGAQEKARHNPEGRGGPEE